MLSADMLQSDDRDSFMLCGMCRLGMICSVSDSLHTVLSGHMPKMLGA